MKSKQKLKTNHMNSFHPMKALMIILLSLAIFSCGKKENKEQEQLQEQAVPEIENKEEKAEEPSKKNLTTSTGKTFEVETQSEGSSVMNIIVSPKDFPNSTDSWKIEGADPLADSFTADLDQNGFEELYLVTRSVGSGSYGRLYGYASNNDKSATPIYVPEPSETDLAQGGDFYGYMGHDSIYLDQGRLFRKFPVYNEGDENCCPTGGDRLLEYELTPGEASWILRIKD